MATRAKTEHGHINRNGVKQKATAENVGHRRTVEECARDEQERIQLNHDRIMSTVRAREARK